MPDRDGRMQNSERRAQVIADNSIILFLGLRENYPGQI